VDEHQRREELPDHALVVRGGPMTDFDAMSEDAQTEQRRIGYPGLSVRAAVDITVEQLVRASFSLPHNRIRVSTVGRLRQGGFSLRKLPGLHHYNVVINSLGPQTMERLTDLFDEPIPNPVPRSERRKQ
jgi:hypothetical protein